MTKLKNYFNVVSKNNRIFTREDIESMTPDEFAQNESAIIEQLKAISIPTNGDMQREAINKW